MAQFYRKGVLNVLTMHEAVSANAWQAFRRARGPVDKLRQFYRWTLILRYEKMMCRRFDRVVTMTEDDAEYLRSYSPQANVGAIPIGIDPAIFAPVLEETERPVEILFIGNFRHRPNVEAAEFLVERIAPCFPETRFIIAGARPPDHLHNRRANVSFPGYVPDMRTLYHGTNTIVVAPLFSGTGQRVKLLEAFAMGCPVITTTIGAKGFPAGHGLRALIANTDKECVAALARLICSPELRHQLGENARRMIEQNFSWERVGAKLLEVFDT
jgi:glycosyltransferase involved in cell wall biosynthesis